MKKNFIVYFLLSSSIMAWQKIDLNKANKEQIALLPGIGKKAAEEIINQRAIQNFSDVHQLKSIKGISDNKIEQIKNLVTFSSSTQEKFIKKPSLTNQVFILEKPNLMPLKDLEEKILQHVNLQYQDDKNAIARVRNANFAPNLTIIADADKNIVSSKKKELTKETLNAKEDINVGLGIKVEFEFDKLIFNDDEINLANLMLKKLEHRYELLEKVHQHYFSYKNIQESNKKITSSKELKDIHQQLEMHAAVLDSYSNNAFSNFIKEGQK